LSHLLLEVEPDFLVETALERVGSTERSQTPPALPYPAHVGLSLHHRGVEHLVDGTAGAAPLRQLRVELPPALAGPGVIAGAPLVSVTPPLRWEEPLPLQPIEGRVQRALAELEDVLRPLLDSFGDAPAVHGLELQRLEHEHVERALQEVASFLGHPSPFDGRKDSTRSSFRLSRGVADARGRLQGMARRRGAR